MACRVCHPATGSLSHTVMSHQVGALTCDYLIIKPSSPSKAEAHSLAKVLWAGETTSRTHVGTLDLVRVSVRADIKPGGAFCAENKD